MQKLSFKNNDNFKQRKLCRIIERKNLKIWGEYEDKKLGPEYLNLVRDLQVILNYGKYASPVLTTAPSWNGKEGEQAHRFEVNGTGYNYYVYYWVNSGWTHVVWTGVGNTLLPANGSITNAMIADSALTYTAINPASNITRCFTGSYTGDGNATKAITGVGFPPKFLKINAQASSVSSSFEKTNQDGTKCAYDQGGAWYYEDDYVISLDANGFTVGDGTGGSSAEHANKLNRVYTVIAYG